MTEKFVIRLLADDNSLLAWAEVHATATPQQGRASCPFFAPRPTQFRIDEAGTATKISVHWCALDVARVQSLVEPVPVQRGQVFNMNWIEPIWLVSGMRDVPLPAVTVGTPVSMSIPLGKMGAVAP
jgi:hypothetical protein